MPQLFKIGNYWVYYGRKDLEKFAIIVKKCLEVAV